MPWDTITAADTQILGDGHQLACVPCPCVPQGSPQSQPESPQNPGENKVDGLGHESGAQFAGASL